MQFMFDTIVTPFVINLSLCYCAAVSSLLCTYVIGIRAQDSSYVVDESVVVGGVAFSLPACREVTNEGE
jgi:hypothetical protein